MNISIITERGAFFNLNIDLSTATVSAEFYVKKIEQRARTIAKERITRINAILTDTCDTILKAERVL
jgi:hypothetical protein